MTNLTVNNYWNDVISIAQETIDEYPDREDYDARNMYIAESVDGSHWVIYHHANETVLRATTNEPDGEEVRSMCADDAGWRQMRTTAAYMAMELDVHEQIMRLEDEDEDD